jgi:hypothetical protein
MEAAVEDLTPAKLWPDIAIPVEAATLSRRFHISVEAIIAAFGKDADRKIWVRNL